MKLLIAIVLLAVLGAAGLHAQLIAYESFKDIAPGSVAGKSGSDSFGWTGPWVGTSDPHIQVISGANLSYQITDGSLLRGGDTALALTTAPEPVPASVQITRSFPDITNPFYISFIVRVPAVGTGNDRIEFNLMNGDTIIRTFAFTPGVTNSNFVWVWQLPPNSPLNGAPNSIGGDPTKTYFCVIEAISASYPNSYFLNQFSNPGVTYPGQPAAVGQVIPKFNRIGFVVTCPDTAGAATTMYVDEIRIGNLWRDVIPDTGVPIVPDIALNPAIHIQWPTVSGKKYRLQYSYDNINWINIGSLITGTGLMKEYFEAQDTASKKFFRVQIQ